MPKKKSGSGGGKKFGAGNTYAGPSSGVNTKNTGGASKPGSSAQGSQASRQGSGSQAGGINDDGTPAAPSARELVGGASWTGKLPADIFNEHARKQGWERVDYNVRNTNEGFFCIVIIRYKNNKTQQTEEVQFTPPKVLGNNQATRVEARNYGATYALNRVCSMKNIHMLLPPSHQTYWKEFEAIRKQHVEEGKGWMYEADPFGALRERAAAEEKEKKEREARNEARKKASACGQVVPGNGKNYPKVTNSMKGWENVPKVEMAKNMRIWVEELIRKCHVWNPAGIEMSPETKEQVIRQLTALGFRKSHVKEACEWTKDYKECLEWLLVHIPEDDLPQPFLPSNYTVGISIVGPNESMATVSAAKRLSEAGYSLERCREALAIHNGNEALAAERLMHMLISKNTNYSPLEPNLVSFEEGEPWEEEQLSFEVIWGADCDSGHEGEPKFTRESQTVSRILLELDPPPPKRLRSQIPKPLYVKLQKPVNNYPSAVPVITIHSPPGQPKLPAHVRLSIIRQAATYAQEECLGEQMVFSIVDWLQRNFIRIVEDPGKLRDVACAITHLEIPSEEPDKRKKRIDRPKRQEKPRMLNSDNSMRLFLQRKGKLSSLAMQKMINSRKMLPAWNKREEIVDAINSSQVTIITGETGSGKSTQAVQFILDDLVEKRLGGFANIFCTQPRRISALGLADRVAEERCCIPGEEVGHIIKGDSKYKEDLTRITFVTTGVLLRRLQMGTMDTKGDQWAGFTGISHVFVDEVHERSLDTDFLLILLKNALCVMKDLKVVLMSATVNAESLAEYFRGGPNNPEVKVGMVNIEGRTFPVEDIYVDEIIRRTDFELIYNHSGNSNSSSDLSSSTEGMDPITSSIIRSIGDRINYALIAQTVQYIDEDLDYNLGGILVFLPGTMEINRAIDAINNLPKASSRFHVLPLHASLLPSEQKLVFPPAPSGKRKIIAATNVAETSITIEDIVAVIDTGRVKETSYDVQYDMARLIETWASRAACKQRKGRAGRVRAGTCYKLFTKNFEENKMKEQSEPEIKRVPLQQTCLNVKGMGINDVREFLASTLTPPETSAVEGALVMLDKMGAFKDGDLTALGRHMSIIPTDLRSSKLLVYGSIFCILDRSLTIASILSTSKSPFYSPIDKRDESRSARTSFGGVHGDLLADMFAFEQWYNLRYIQNQPSMETKIWCESNYLSHHTLLDILSNKTQLFSALRECGFLPYDSYRKWGDGCSLDIQLNSNSESLPLLKALILAAFTPQVARIAFPEKKFIGSFSGAVELDPEARTIKYFTNDVGRVFLHPGSTLFSLQNYPSTATFLSYFVKGATGGGGTTSSIAAQERREKEKQEEQEREKMKEYYEDYISGSIGGTRRYLPPPLASASSPSPSQEESNKPTAGGGGGGGGQKVFLREVTPVNTYSVLLFGGDLGIDSLGRGLTVDGWMRIKGWGRIGVLVNMIRGLLDRVVARGVEDPLMNSGSGDDNEEGKGRIGKRIIKEGIGMGMGKLSIDTVAGGSGDGGEGWSRGGVMVEQQIAKEVIEVVKRLVELNGMDE